jgi:hypothetical protein
MYRAFKSRAPALEECLRALRFPAALGGLLSRLPKGGREKAGNKTIFKTVPILFNHTLKRPINQQNEGAVLPRRDARASVGRPPPPL